MSEAWDSILIVLALFIFCAILFLIIGGAALYLIELTNPNLPSIILNAIVGLPVGAKMFCAGILLLLGSYFVVCVLESVD